MKKNLESAFKESLKDFEAPYNPKAWEAVSAQLDARAAAGGSAISSILKWTAACVLVGGLVVGAYYLIPNNNTQTVSTQTEKDINTDIRIINNKDNHSEGTSTNEDKTSQKVIVGKQQKGEENTLKASDSNPEKQLNTSVLPDSKVADNQSQSNVNRNSEPMLNDGDEHNDNGVPSYTLESKSAQFIEGHISMLNICEGENVVISNPSRNKSLVKLQKDDGQIVLLDPGKSYVFKPKSSTKINFINNENDRISTKRIKVHSLPSVNFIYEANIFEKGLPVVVCEAYGDYASYTWSFDDETARNGAKTLHNFFKKGDHDVTLKVIDRNGCENSMKRKVHIRKNYNLMAVDAFIPNGSDSRNRTFMPYSLTERDVDFQLTIIDPTDNGVVYTSKDAKNTWDGTDQRTGEMTASNKTFIWKVQIYNPVPNERPIYSGSIVHD